MASTCSTCKEPICACFLRRPVAETSLSTYKALKDYLERAEQQELAKVIFGVWHHAQQELLEASLSSPTVESSPGKQTYMLKASLGAEIRRCKLTWPSNASEDYIYQVIHEEVEKHFPHRDGTSTTIFKFKYADDDGDLCTMGPTAIPDFLEMARGKMLRLRVYWNDAHCNAGSRDADIAGLRAEIERLREHISQFGPWMKTAVEGAAKASVTDVKAIARTDDEIELISDEETLCSEHPRCHHPRPAWLKVKEGWDWCSLCRKYAVPGHLNCQKHKKRLRWHEWWEAQKKQVECNDCHSEEPCGSRSVITQESVTQPGTVSAEMAGEPSEPSGNNADAPRASQEQRLLEQLARVPSKSLPASLQGIQASASAESIDSTPGFQSESGANPDPLGGADSDPWARALPLQGRKHMQMPAEPEGDDCWSNYVGCDYNSLDNNNWWNNDGCTYHRWGNDNWRNNDGDDNWGNYEGWGWTNHGWGCGNRDWRNNHGFSDHGWGNNQRRGGVNNY